MPRDPGTRRTLLLGALALVVLAVAGVVVTRLIGSDDADLAASGFAGDWEKGKDRQAAGRTDDERAALAGLRANRRGLDGATVSTDVRETTDKGDTATSRVHVVWQVPGIGPFAYDTRIPLAKRDGKWSVHWTNRLVHPGLGAESRLGTVRTARRRGEIQDHAGRPLVTARPVRRVGVVAGKVKDPRATAAGLAKAVGVDPRPLERQIRRGGRQQFVEAIALREDDYRARKAAIDGVDGVQVIDGTAQLAPTRAFARALLGGVAPATAEQLKKLGSRYAPGDEVGQWGLAQRYERTLGGVPGRQVVIRTGGAPTRTLLRRPGRDGRPLRTTLDPKVQSAAESALGDRPDEAALVAVRPSSGDILAVANRPVDSTYDRALAGNYPPGSTFKVVTTAALLKAGLSPAQSVDCPRTITVDGRSFKNFEGGAGGPQPFAQDFAKSCNTAFVSLAPRLGSGALGSTGRLFGLGRSPDLPLPAAKSQVPAGRTKVERAASMIGQARILASPLAMAGVAGTVAAGRWHAPRLVSTDRPGAAAPLPAGDVGTLRTLMRAVVTEGTGTALAAVPGEPRGKSGTAEFGGGDPPPTHAWFIAFRGDLALAVLVEKGRSGGAVAAPLAARFFTALGGG
jgi:cell division protein FtsI/penicillin-binding protein 2